jgi:hypothetical protein
VPRDVPTQVNTHHPPNAFILPSFRALMGKLQCMSPELADIVAKRFCPSDCARLIQVEAPMRNIDSNTLPRRFDCADSYFTERLRRLLQQYRPTSAVLASHPAWRTVSFPHTSGGREVRPEGP